MEGRKKMKKISSLLAILFLGFILNNQSVLAEETGNEEEQPPAAEEKEHLDLGETNLKFTISGKKGPLKITEVPQLTYYLKKEYVESTKKYIGSGKLKTKGNLVVSDETQSSGGWSLQVGIVNGQHGLDPLPPATQGQGSILMLNMKLLNTNLDIQETDAKLLIGFRDTTIKPSVKIAETLTGYNNPAKDRVTNTFTIDDENSSVAYEGTAPFSFGERTHFLLNWDLVTDPI